MTIARHHGKWRYDFWKNGARHTKGGYPTKQEAKDAETDARRKIGTTNRNFIELCASRLKDLSKNRSSKFFKENERLIKKLIILWGSRKEVSRHDVEEYLDTIESPFVANKDLRLIKALYNHGIKKEWFIYNPAGKISFRPVEKKRKHIPTKEDIEKVLAKVNDEQRNYLLTIINTLARINEINNLKWSDVFDDYLILQTRKAKNSNLKERSIPFNRTLKKIFKKRGTGYVFTYRGEPIGYRSKFLKNACKKAGVKPFGYHALRHYGASTLANANIPLADIQEILGHEKITTTAIYIQSLRGSVRNSLRILDRLTPKSPTHKKTGSRKTP